MRVFDSLRSALAGRARPEDGGAYWVHVQCGRCGEALRVRVDPRYDLMQEFGSSDRVAGYSLHKDIIGSGRCFQLIRVDQALDTAYRVKKQEIRNGRFLTAAEYQALAAAAAKP